MSSEFGQKGKIGDRFDREAEILQQLRHPNIVRFLAWGRFRGTSYIAMEYVQGETVEKMIADRGHLPWREVVELGIQICDALHYAHEHGVVHRDLKPSNLMVTADGKIKLTDFGIAKDLDATALTATGPNAGNGGLHVSRTNPGHARRQPQDRSLCTRGCALPDAGWQGAVRGNDAGRSHALPLE